MWQHGHESRSEWGIPPLWRRTKGSDWTKAGFLPQRLRKCAGWYFRMYWGGGGGGLVRTYIGKANSATGKFDAKS